MKRCAQQFQHDMSHSS